MFHFTFIHGFKDNFIFFANLFSYEAPCSLMLVDRLVVSNGG